MNIKAERVWKIYKEDKSLSNREIARRAKTSRRHVRRLLNPYRTVEPVGKGGPKILVFDIETLPMEILVWGLYKQRIPPDNVLRDWCCLGWAGKWLFDSTVMSDILTPEEAIIKDDSRILNGIWKLIDEADILVAHNGMRFDIRKLNARFITNNMPQTSSHQFIDTLKEAKKYFAFSSYTLGFINKILGLDVKKSTSYSLWKRCRLGDKDALRNMNLYNIQDTLILEDLYLKLRPWIKSHPNYNLYIDTDKELCPNCGDINLHWEGKYYTPMGRFKSFRCSNCGAIGRSRYSDISKEERRLLVASIAR